MALPAPPGPQAGEDVISACDARLDEFVARRRHGIRRRRGRRGRLRLSIIGQHVPDFAGPGEEVRRPQVVVKAIVIEQEVRAETVDDVDPVRVGGQCEQLYEDAETKQNPSAPPAGDGRGCRCEQPQHGEHRRQVARPPGDVALEEHKNAQRCEETEARDQHTHSPGPVGPQRSPQPRRRR